MKNATLVFKDSSGNLYYVRPQASGDNIVGTVPVASGGTGQTTLALARNAMGLGNTTGALPIANGGTGQTTVALARNALGLGNTTGALPVANGGTGQTTVQAFRNSMGLGNTTGALPVANGGTGAADAATARTNLGAQSKLKTATATLTAAGWSSNKQTVTISGITANSIVWVSYAAASKEAYGDAGIYASAQGANTLTFTCETVPSTSISVNVSYADA